jgi:hypothetical protein
VSSLRWDVAHIPDFHAFAFETSGLDGGDVLDVSRLERILRFIVNHNVFVVVNGGHVESVG